MFTGAKVQLSERKTKFILSFPKVGTFKTVFLRDINKHRFKAFFAIIQ